MGGRDRPGADPGPASPRRVPPGRAGRLWLQHRRRLRAIEERWLPLLESTLRAAELGLEEQEHADGVRLRWARSAASRARSPDGQSRGRSSSA